MVRLKSMLPWATVTLATFLGGFDCAGLVDIPDRQLAADEASDAGGGADATRPVRDGGIVDAAIAREVTTDAALDSDGDAPADTRPGEAAQDADAGNAHDASDAPPGTFCAFPASVTTRKRVLCDDFEDGDASVGGTWDAAKGAVSIDSTESFPPPTAGHSLMLDVPSASDDEAEVTRLFVAAQDAGATPSSESIELAFDLLIDSAPMANVYLAEIDLYSTFGLSLMDGEAGGSPRLQEYVDGQEYLQANVDAPAWTPGSWFHVDVLVHLEKSASTVSVTIGDVMIVSSQPLQPSWGPGEPTVSLEVNPQATTGIDARVHFDNVEFYVGD